MSLTLRRQRRTTPYAKVAPLAADARDTAVKYAGSTRDWAAPKIEPAVEKVKDEVLPAVAGAVTAALAAAEPVRHEAAVRGSAALAALRGEVAAPKPKKHRLRKLVLLASVLGAAYAGWKAWVAQSTVKSDPVEPWTSSSVTPVPATVGSTGAAASPLTPADRPTTDDPAGAGPDEALADAAEESAIEDSSAAASSTTVTEKVTPAQAKKATEAAQKGAAKKGGSTTS